MHSKGVAGAFFVSVHSNGVTGVDECQSTSALPIVHEALIPGGFKSNEFLREDSKACARRWQVSVHCKGLKGADKARASSQSKVESPRLGPGIFVCAEKFSSRIFVAQQLKIRKAVASMTYFTFHFTTRQVRRLRALRIFFC